jgi:glycosyltransferase involved in cell wall biosynthesis
MSVVVIIPTTGSPELKDAIESVLNQSYKDTTCYVVIDGEENNGKVDKIIGSMNPKDWDKIKIAYLPINVGAKGFYGHRVYAAFTHLVNTDYVMYLDQDNWLYQSHITKCIETIETRNLDWCYSLRKIHKKDGQFVCFDDCESLGKWPTYHGTNHIDTNTYFIKTSIATKIASVWHGGWGQDRVFLQAITQHFPKWDCTNEYTVSYRVDGGKGSVNEEFFINGNAVMNEKYNGIFPWRTKTLT